MRLGLFELASLSQSGRVSVEGELPSPCRGGPGYAHRPTSNNHVRSVLGRPICSGAACGPPRSDFHTTHAELNKRACVRNREQRSWPLDALGLLLLLLRLLRLLRLWFQGSLFLAAPASRKCFPDGPGLDLSALSRPSPWKHDSHLPLSPVCLSCLTAPRSRTGPVQTTQQ